MALEDLDINNAEHIADAIDYCLVLNRSGTGFEYDVESFKELIERITNQTGTNISKPFQKALRSFLTGKPEDSTVSRFAAMFQMIELCEISWMSEPGADVYRLAINRTLRTIIIDPQNDLARCEIDAIFDALLKLYDSDSYFRNHEEMTNFIDECKNAKSKAALTLKDRLFLLKRQTDSAGFKSVATYIASNPSADDLSFYCDIVYLNAIAQNLLYQFGKKDEYQTVQQMIFDMLAASNRSYSSLIDYAFDNKDFLPELQDVIKAKQSLVYFLNSHDVNDLLAILTHDKIRALKLDFFEQLEYLYQHQLENGQIESLYSLVEKINKIDDLFLRYTNAAALLTASFMMSSENSTKAMDIAISQIRLCFESGVVDGHDLLGLLNMLMYPTTSQDRLPAVKELLSLLIKSDVSWSDEDIDLLIERVSPFIGEDRSLIFSFFDSLGTNRLVAWVGQEQHYSERWIEVLLDYYNKVITIKIANEELKPSEALTWLIFLVKIINIVLTDPIKSNRFSAVLLSDLELINSKYDIGLLIEVGSTTAQLETMSCINSIWCFLNSGTVDSEDGFAKSFLSKSRDSLHANLRSYTISLLQLFIDNQTSDAQYNLQSYLDYIGYVIEPSDIPHWINYIRSLKLQNLNIDDNKARVQFCNMIFSEIMRHLSMLPESTAEKFISLLEGNRALHRFLEPFYDALDVNLIFDVRTCSNLVAALSDPLDEGTFNVLAYFRRVCDPDIVDQGKMPLQSKAYVLSQLIIIFAKRVDFITLEKSGRTDAETIAAVRSDEQSRQALQLLQSFGEDLDSYLQTITEKIDYGTTTELLSSIILISGILGVETPEILSRIVSNSRMQDLFKPASSTFRNFWNVISAEALQPFMEHPELVISILNSRYPVNISQVDAAIMFEDAWKHNATWLQDFIISKVSLISFDYLREMLEVRERCLEQMQNRRLDVPVELNFEGSVDMSFRALIKIALIILDERSTKPLEPDEIDLLKNILVQWDRAAYTAQTLEGLKILFHKVSETRSPREILAICQSADPGYTNPEFVTIVLDRIDECDPGIRAAAIAACITDTVNQFRVQQCREALDKFSDKTKPVTYMLDHMEEVCFEGENVNWDAVYLIAHAIEKVLLFEPGDIVSDEQLLDYEHAKDEIKSFFSSERDAPLTQKQEQLCKSIKLIVIDKIYQNSQFDSASLGKEWKIFNYVEPVSSDWRQIIERANFNIFAGELDIPLAVKCCNDPRAVLHLTAAEIDTILSNEGFALVKSALCFTWPDLEGCESLNDYSLKLQSLQSIGVYEWAMLAHVSQLIYQREFYREHPDQEIRELTADMPIEDIIRQHGKIRTYLLHQAGYSDITLEPLYSYTEQENSKTDAAVAKVLDVMCPKLDVCLRELRALILDEIMTLHPDKHELIDFIKDNRAGLIDGSITDLSLFVDNDEPIPAFRFIVDLSVQIQSLDLLDLNMLPFRAIRDTKIGRTKLIIANVAMLIRLVFLAYSDIDKLKDIPGLETPEARATKIAESKQSLILLLSGARRGNNFDASGADASTCWYGAIAWMLRAFKAHPILGFDLQDEVREKVISSYEGLLSKKLNEVFGSDLTEAKKSAAARRVYDLIAYMTTSNVQQILTGKIDLSEPVLQGANNQQLFEKHQLLLADEFSDIDGFITRISELVLSETPRKDIELSTADHAYMFMLYTSAGLDPKCAARLFDRYDELRTKYEASEPALFKKLQSELENARHIFSIQERMDVRERAVNLRLAKQNFKTALVNYVSAMIKASGIVADDTASETIEDKIIDRLMKLFDDAHGRQQLNAEAIKQAVTKVLAKHKLRSEVQAESESSVSKSHHRPTA